MSKHAPTTREEFKAKVRRTLGEPVIQINVSDDQVEDCVEEALKYWYDYHYDGSEHTYLKLTVTPTDITNGYFTLPANVVGAVKVYSLNTSLYTLYSSDMWSGGYQMAYDLVYNMSSGSMLTFYMYKQQYEFLNQMLIGQVPIRYNRKNQVLHIDFSWNKMNVGDGLVVDCYTQNNPDDNPDVWNDRWLLKYTAAKVKVIWGSNLSKFEGLQLPGGVTFNGNKMRDDAVAELKELEEEMLVSYSIPPRDVVA